MHYPQMSLKYDPKLREVHPHSPICEIIRLYYIDEITINYFIIIQADIDTSIGLLSFQ